MGVFSRLSDIVSSNINSLLDKAENPEKMVRLIIQEMEDTLVEVRSTSAKTIANKKHLERQLLTYEQEILAWQQKAELALSKDREDLAKGALLEKAQLGDDKAEAERQIELVEQDLDKLNQDIAQLEIKLQDAKARQKAMLMQTQTAQSRLKVRNKLHSNEVTEVAGKFEQYETKLDRLQAEVEAYDVGRNKSLAEEFAALEADERIESELAELKAKVSGQQQPNTDSE